MEGEKGGVSITFDEGNQIRVLPADKYKETEAMKNECLSFLKSIYSIYIYIYICIYLLQ